MSTFPVDFPHLAGLEPKTDPPDMTVGVPLTLSKVGKAPQGSEAAQGGSK